jgi:AraC-like DNA-binding protein
MTQASSDPARVLHGTGLSVDAVMAGDAPIRVWQQLICARNSAAMMRRADWHLAWVARLAEHFHGPITAAWLSAPTLGAGIDVFIKYVPMRIPYLAWRTRLGERHFRCEVRPLMDLGDLSPLLQEIPLLTLIEYIKRLRPGHLDGVTLELAHAPLAAVEHYQKRLRCDVQFGAARCALSIPRAWRELPNPGYDEAMWGAALRRCEGALLEHPDAATIGVVTRALFDSFEQAWGRRTPPTLEDMAAHLHISVRTLNRRLRAAATTYQQLVDDVRKQRARELLADAKRRLGDIAGELGFQDPASFGRSFKRWYGSTPGQYRRRQAAGARPA